MAGVTQIENAYMIPLRENSQSAFTGGVTDRQGRVFEVAQTHRDGVALENGASIPLNIRDQEETLFYGGILFPHFGHFLCESLGRLWAYERVRSLNPKVVFLLAWPWRWSEAQKWVLEFLKAFGIPQDCAFLASGATAWRVNRLLVPDQVLGLGMLRPTPEWLDFVRRVQFRTNIVEYPRKVYVTRHGMPIDKGYIAGEFALADAFRDEGFLIMDPLDYSIGDQHALLSNAETLVFAEGSATLWMVLLPNIRAKVVVICRRSGVRRTSLFRNFGICASAIDEVLMEVGGARWNRLALLDWTRVSNQLLEYGVIGRKLDLPALQLGSLRDTVLFLRAKLLRPATSVVHKHA